MSGFGALLVGMRIKGAPRWCKFVVHSRADNYYPEETEQQEPDTESNRPHVVFLNHSPSTG